MRAWMVVSVYLHVREWLCLRIFKYVRRGSSVLNYYGGRRIGLWLYSVECMRMCVQASVYLQPFASMGDVVECHSFPGRRIGHAHLSMYVSAIESQASAPGIVIDKGSRSLRVRNRCSHFCAITSPKCGRGARSVTCFNTEAH